MLFLTPVLVAAMLLPATSMAAEKELKSKLFTLQPSGMQMEITLTTKKRDKYTSRVWATLYRVNGDSVEKINRVRVMSNYFNLASKLTALKFYDAGNDTVNITTKWLLTPSLGKATIYMVATPTYLTLAG